MADKAASPTFLSAVEDGSVQFDVKNDDLISVVNDADADAGNIMRLLIRGYSNKRDRYTKYKE